MINLPEILIIVAIVVIVFGVGKVGNIGAHLREAKLSFKDGLDGDDSPDELESEREVIDITPSDRDDDPSYDPKPGTKKDPVEDADVEPSS